MLLEEASYQYYYQINSDPDVSEVTLYTFVYTGIKDKFLIAEQIKLLSYIHLYIGGYMLTLRSKYLISFYVKEKPAPFWNRRKKAA